MILYRTIETVRKGYDEKNNLERLDMGVISLNRCRDYSDFSPDINTISMKRRNQMNDVYFYFYAEDAIKYAYILGSKDVRRYNLMIAPYVIQFDIDEQLLAPNVCLGAYGYNYFSKPYAALEFAIPYSSLITSPTKKKFVIDKRHKILEKYKVPYFNGNKILVPSDFQRKSYIRFQDEFLKEFLEVLHARISEPGSIVTYHDDYSEEAVAKILTKIK